MQIVRQFDHDEAALVGWGVRVLLLAPDHGLHEGRVAARIAGLGGVVEQETDFYSALDALDSDHTGFGLFVMEADAFGGLEEARRMLAQLRRTDPAIPVIVIASDCTIQNFPTDDRAAIELRAPLSAVSLRVGFEHAMRHRLVFKVA